MSTECTTPTQTGSIAVDYFMIIIATLSLLITLYGLYQYIVHYKNVSPKERPATPLFVTGLIFFIISSLTLINALLYDIFYLVCTNLDNWEGPIYHSAYFIQIYTLWLTLFGRLYYVFKDSAFRLSKTAVIGYIVSFVIVALIMVPMYFVFQFEVETFVTLPYVTLSIIFNTSLLIGFIYKLSQLLAEMDTTHKQQTDPLLIIMTKNTLLAVISIGCTFFVIIMLIYLYIRYQGHHEKHSDIEEFILEFTILIDIVSNFICILLSYQLFKNEYNRFCKCCNDRLHKYLHIEIDKQIKRIQSQSQKTLQLSSNSNMNESTDITIDETQELQAGGQEIR